MKYLSVRVSAQVHNAGWKFTKAHSTYFTLSTYDIQAKHGADAEMDSVAIVHMVL